MRLSGNETEKSKTLIANAKQRPARKTQLAQELLLDRHPADQAQAELLILEQSLLAMTRYLARLVTALQTRGKGGFGRRKPPSKVKL